MNDENSETQIGLSRADVEAINNLSRSITVDVARFADLWNSMQLQWDHSSIIDVIARISAPLTLPYVDVTRALGESLQRLAEEHAESIRAISTAFQGITTDVLGPWMDRLRVLADEDIIFGKNYTIIDEVTLLTGRLPFRTIPYGSYIEEEERDVDRIAQRVNDYFDQEEEAILSDIQSGLASHNVDDEARETLTEAIENHRISHYRSTCRLLAPEIERVIREHVLALPMGKVVNAKELDSVIGDSTFEELAIQGTHDVVVALRMMKHWYSFIDHKQGPQAIAAVQDAPTPNRHAISHGWLPYSTPQDSLNTIILTDYLYRIVTVQKAA